MTISQKHKNLLNLTILITGLGYFVDSFDAFLLNVIRTPSLKEMGFSGDTLTHAGVLILNWQVTGTLFGGIFWGTLGDKLGRKRALLGSILMYSLGQFANAFVHSVPVYAAVRFVVGFGIAGEVGLGATLVGEVVRTSKRTYSLACFTAIGLLGVVSASLSIELVSWRITCLLGGAGGLVLLFLRHRLFESPLFDALAIEKERRGRFWQILLYRTLLRKWLCCIFILAPNFFITGFLLTLAPEFAKAAGIAMPIKANIALALYFTFAVAGDFMSAYLSERWRSRRRVLFIFMSANTALALVYLFLTPHEPQFFYVLCAIFGFFNLWAISTTVAIEQMKTGLRATTTTSSMNFARACLVLINLGFIALKPHGTAEAALMVGALFFTMGFAAIYYLDETYGRPLSDTE
ncbi:MAG: MFS transporter [Proteobacteria bacterium]|nr:MFS transporter [Pseudomonadota bacterium]